MVVWLGKTFAIADLHGRYDLLKEALASLERRYPEGGLIIFLGDYVDRGPASREIIETLMAGPTAPGWRWICLQGNHEQIMRAGCDGDLGWWVPNGGGATLMSYGARHGDDGESAVKLVPQDHLDWVRDLPLYHEDDFRIYVHAGVDEALDLSGTPAEVLQWIRYEPSAEAGYRGKHVVHGHDANPKGPILKSGRSNLDAGAWRTGRLVIGVFDDAQSGGPVRTIEIKGEPQKDPIDFRRLALIGAMVVIALGAIAAATFAWLQH